jgi:GMP synthase-like glutamine amidotransferase
MTLSALIFQHEPDDGPGYLGEALIRRGARLTIVRLDKNEGIPDISAYDLLLVMGGAMNVYQEDKYRWLIEETQAIREAVEAGKAVLGICLGGQLLAKALDAQVHLGVATEIGLTPMTLLISPPEQLHSLALKAAPTKPFALASVRMDCNSTPKSHR